jgi:serine/threonine-protein kinase
MVPETLGPFTLHSLLGQGGTSLVYGASRDGRELALKVLRPELGLDAREVNRFVDEARRMHSLRHRCLVEVLDAGTLPDGRPFIAMPRLRGRSLAERVAELGRLDVPHALALFEGLSGAIATLHAAGLVHRDIKPENVLWLEPPDERLVLLDLGIAREVASGPSTTTRAGLARGTPAYMAPERFFGQPATIASDVYEAAVVFYVCVVGRLPWDPADPKARMAPAPPSSHGVRLPPELEQVLIGALSMSASERPRSIDALHAALSAAWQRWAASPTSDPSIVMAPTELHRPVQGASMPPGRDGTTLPSASEGGGRVRSTDLTVGGTLRSATPPRTSGAAIAIGGAIALVAALVGGGLVYLASTGGLRLRVGDTGEASDTDDEDAPKKRKKKRASSEDADDQAAGASSGASSAAPDASAPSASTEPSSRAPTSRPPIVVPPPPPASASSAAMGPMPKPCADFVALMCSPTSGATARECTSWREQVRKWNESMPPEQAAQVCQSAYQSSAKGLEGRRETMPPPTP